MDKFNTLEEKMRRNIGPLQPGYMSSGHSDFDRDLEKDLSGSTRSSMKSGGKGTTPKGFAKGKRPNQSFVTTPAMNLGGKGKKGNSY